VFPRSPVLANETNTGFVVASVPPEAISVHTRVVPAVAPVPPVLPEVIENILKFVDDVVDTTRI
jgi:hypothetical protein